MNAVICKCSNPQRAEIDLPYVRKEQVQDLNAMLVLILATPGGFKMKF